MLINSMLQPKDKFSRKEQHRSHWIFCKRAHATLMDVLSLYGPEIYDPIWNQFKYFKYVSATKASLEDDEIYSEFDNKELSNYSDFWDYTDTLLNHGSANLDSKVTFT